MNYLSAWDFIFAPFYMVLITLVAFYIQKKNIDKKPEYKYFIKGLVAKFIGAIAFCLVYALYYGGGDTTNFYFSSIALSNLVFEHFSGAFDIIINNNLSPENFALFSYKTSWPSYYMWRDKYTFTVVRYTVPLVILAGKSFIATSILVATFSYIGIWKLYQLFCSLYPQSTKQLAYAILFIPTTIFWGSGIMKDSYTLGATCWLTYNFYQVFILRKNLLLNGLFLFMNVIIILNIKAYVLLSLIPGILLWLNSAYIQKVSSGFLKVIFLPFFIVVFVGGGYLTFTSLSSEMGNYGDIDKALEQAKIMQQDLLREEQYGRNSYNIGELDGTLFGALKLAPKAIFTALYRPMFYEIGSPMMVISALENLILLLITIYILLKTGIVNIFKLILNHPILLYSFAFSLFFAFGVGIAGTNFGAMVRYKTPLVPFYFSFIYLIYQIGKEEQSKIKTSVE
jgi:hypothetical protein